MPTGVSFMRPEDICTELKRQPFRPFRIHRSNGKSHEVRHPELVMVGKSCINIGFPSTKHQIPVFDSYEVISLLHINNLELLSSTPSQPADGAGS
jgi:hypothetical protein